MLWPHLAHLPILPEHVWAAMAAGKGTDEAS
jgi:hypothetical protein